MEIMITFILSLLGCCILNTGAQPLNTTRLVTTTTRPPTAAASGAYLNITPSSVISAGTAANITCTFQVLPASNNIFLMLTNSNGPNNIVRVSTIMMAAAMTSDLTPRVAVYLLDDGRSLQFQYNYVKPSDSGTYQCYVMGGANSNSLGVLVTGTWYGSSSQGNIPPLNYDYSGSQQGGVNIPLVVAVTIGVACLLVSTTLLVLRLKYKDRFMRAMRGRQQRPPRYGNTTPAADAGVNNPTYVLDPEQLPSYNDALKLADDKAFMPPTYLEVVGGPSTASGSAAAPSSSAAGAVALSIPSVSANLTSTQDDYGSIYPTNSSQPYILAQSSNSLAQPYSLAQPTTFPSAPPQSIGSDSDAAV